jgi:two-component system sensor histidine kinase RegB
MTLFAQVSMHSESQSLRYLQVRRSIEIAGQLATIGVAVFWLGLALPLAPMLSVVGALLVILLLTWVRLRWGGLVREAELFAQLLVDVAALAVLI